MPYTGQRDVVNVAGNALRARGASCATSGPELAISTGAAIALSFLPLAAARGVACHYIESAGAHRRAVAQRPAAESQSAGSASTRSTASGRASPGATAARSSTPGSRLPPVRRARRPAHGRHARHDRLLRSGACSSGSSRSSRPASTWSGRPAPPTSAGCPIAARASMPGAELDAAIAAADVVVSHSGIGSAIATLEAGRCPLLVPRERRFGEHVDDHQRADRRASSRRAGSRSSRSVAELTLERRCSPPRPCARAAASRRRSS